MNNEKIVEVEYHDPERNGLVHTVGRVQEGCHHLLLLSEEVESVDLYSFTIIPKKFVERIIQLKFK